ncbi:phosphatidylinositol 4-phosphate 3-kinase C2 domain-containing subunit gamma isoform X1 [Bufo bufo]|uniref:phosphatidylinositol 4-phosphate 3-kinase C2 domain-containing subunit gamma isoform X1 n=2 Tax=Bufo bufo TaxID=8384 RepID=UPI001ABEC2D9|nr:phosphatidylinositol 4-phosphate 3-kinase C2 domain-containing subunit gamma isoform X1 [Bufo bufo]
MTVYQEVSAAASCQICETGVIMNPPFNIGFSDHVMNFHPEEQFPQFSAPPGFHHVTHGPENMILNVPTPPSVFASTTPSVFAPASLESGSSWTQAAAPYGFITNNWMEEQQSWFPQPPAPYLCSEETEEETQTLPITIGFRIGFENYGDLDDPTVHYHHIDSVGVHVPAGRLVRSHTLDASTWPWDRLYMDRNEMRHHSLYDSHITAPQYHGYSSQTQTIDWRIKLQEIPVKKNPEVAAFSDAVWRIRQKYCAYDQSTNSGRLWSVAVPFPDDIKDSEVEIFFVGDSLHDELHTLQRDSVRIKDLVAEVLHQIEHPARPVLATCPPASLYPLLHAPSHDLYPHPHDLYSVKTQSLYPSLQLPVQPVTPGEKAEPVPGICYLSICGLDEYLQPAYSLRSHTALQRERSVRLRLHIGGNPQPLLGRTIEDDQMELSLCDRFEHAQYWQEMKKRLFGAVSHYEDQVQYFLHNQSAGVSQILEAVKEICYLLRSVETQEISLAVQNLGLTLQQPSMNWAQFPQVADPMQLALMELSKVVSGLLSIYSHSFHTDFTAELNRKNFRMKTKSTILSFHLYAVHNLPENWMKSDSFFYISCSVIYAGRKICPEVKSSHVAASKSFFFRAVWDEMIRFQVPTSSLPYESMLVLRLCAVNQTTPSGSFIAWSCLPLYYNQQIVQGELLLNMISHSEPPAVITPGAFDVSLPTLLTVQVDFLDSEHVFQRPTAEETLYDAGAENLVQPLQCLAHRSSVLLLSEVDKQCLWYYRQCRQKPANILPLILGSTPSWDPASVSAMYRVLDDWTFSGPLEALGLLSPCFADEKVRTMACQQLERLSSDELLMFLPQLVQAVKFEWHLDNALVRLLLDRSLQSIQVAHRLYWLLTDASTESHYRGLYQRLLDAVEQCVGRALNDQFSRQQRLMKILKDVAEKVKNSPEDKRQEALKLGLNDIDRFFEEVGVCRLPLDPGIVVKGIDRDLCSFFKSNAKPLKISFINADQQGPNIHIMFKTGDDMRQDMLVLQLVELMDRIWLHEGLDLRMITYKCVSIGHKQGLVHLVPDSITLAKIQNKTGLLGPLKDSSMKKWFYNNKMASDNFLCSCAGWCVITFLLGVCDRHNDNIMLTSSGHMFHIDFGKFMGNAQKFGKIKRDRAPFIFTTEMESFITEEGKRPERAQEFAELCCCAYNIIRRYSYLIITLLELMLQGGLPELCTVEDLKYVHNKLRPYDSDVEAANYFTSKIKESLESPSVKLNFLIHAFANMTPSDLSRMSEEMTPSLTKFIKRAAVKGMQKVQRASGRILSELGVLSGTEPTGTRDSGRMVQLKVSFSAPKLCIILKHLRNIYMPDGSEPTASVTISLHSGMWEISRQKISSQSRTCAPVFNQLVEFSVPQLDGYILRILVNSNGTFLGQLSLPLSTIRLHEDIWYRLGV